MINSIRLKDKISSSVKIKYYREIDYNYGLLILSSPKDISKIVLVYVNLMDVFEEQTLIQVLKQFKKLGEYKGEEYQNVKDNANLITKEELEELEETGVSNDNYIIKRKR